MRNFPDWLDAFVKLYKNVKAPEVYKYWTGMATLAGAVERKLWWTNGTFWWYPNLYIFLVGERSSGKSTIAAKSLDMLQELQDFELAPTQMNETSLLFTLKQVGQKKSFEYHGKHYRNSSFFMYGSEGAKLFGETSAHLTIVPTIVELFNSGDNFWSDKPCLKKVTRSHGTEEIFNPCINMLACSTATWLMTKILSKEDVEGGLGSRILYAVFPEDAPAARRTVLPDVEHFAQRDRLVADLKQIATLKGGFIAEPGWIEAFDAYNVKHDKAQLLLKYRDPMLQGCLARKANTHLVKLSMLLAVAEGDELVLKARHAHRAWELLEGLEEAMPYAFGRFGVSEEVMHVHEIWRFLETCGDETITLEELSRVFAKQFTVKRVKEAVSDLVQQGKLRVQLGASTGRKRSYHIISSPGQSPESPSPAQ